MAASGECLHTACALIRHRGSAGQVVRAAAGPLTTCFTACQSLYHTLPLFVCVLLSAGAVGLGFRSTMRGGGTIDPGQTMK
jgi:hypothetical protein